MSEHFISREEAERDLLACATYLGESIQSNDGRAQAMAAVVPRYLAKGSVDLAAELANTVDDPFERDRLLITVAEKCASIDDEEYALQLIDAIEDPGMQAQGRERVGILMASRGKIDHARDAADQLDHQDNVLAAIALFQFGQGKLDEALGTVEEIGFPASAAHAYVALAAASIDKGDAGRAAEMLERALSPAEEIEHREERIRTLMDIANSFIAAGRSDRAIEIFELARGHSDELGNVLGESFLAGISLGFLRAGSLELADRTLDAVHDKTQIATALLGFAREFWRREERAEALDALEEAYSILRSQRETETRDSKARFDRYADIAIQFAGFEKGERALEAAHEIADEETAMKALTQIAHVLTIQKSDALAHQALAAVPDNQHRMFALIALSDTAAQNGERERAVALLDEAHALVEEVPQLPSRASAYVEFAKRFAAFDDAERTDTAVRQALESIVAIRDESIKATSLAELSALADELGIPIAEKHGETVKRIVIKAMQRAM